MHGSSLPQDESAGPCRERGVQLSSELQSVECCGWSVTGDKKLHYNNALIEWEYCLQYSTVNK